MQSGPQTHRCSKAFFAPWRTCKILYRGVAKLASTCEKTREKYTKEIIFDDKINVNELLKLYLTVDGWLTQLFPRISVYCVAGV